MHDHEVRKRLECIEHALQLILKILRRQGHEIEEIEHELHKHSYPRTTSVTVKPSR